VGSLVLRLASAQCKETMEGVVLVEGHKKRLWKAIKLLVNSVAKISSI
jgi:hypothetical protein